MAWAISAVGLGGGGRGGRPSSTASRLGLSVYGIKVFPAVILGGLDSIVGAVLGGLIIGAAGEPRAVRRQRSTCTGATSTTIAPFYVLIIILMIKPYGLFGTEDIERV